MARRVTWPATELPPLPADPGALGDAAMLDVGTTAGTVAAGNDTRIVTSAAAVAALGDAAFMDVGTTTNTIAAGDDPRLAGNAAGLDIGTTPGTVAAGDDVRIVTSAAAVATLGSAAFRNVGQVGGTVAAGDDFRLTSLGTAATRNVGTAAGTVAAGDDTRIVNAATVVATLGNAATKNVGSTPGTVAAGDDARLTTLGNAAVRNVGTTAGTVAAGDDARFPVAPGNGYIGLGDSVSVGSGGNGIAWPERMAAVSQQRICYLTNGGVSGNNTSQMLSRLNTDVIAYAPQVVTILGGINDITQAVTTATFKTNITAIVAALKAARIMPVLCTIPPRGNTTNLGKTCTWNDWLRSYARVQGLPLIDFFTLLTDPATGMYTTGYDSGDALHPSQYANLVMATHAATVLTPYLPPYAPIRAVVNTGDTDNLITNPLLLTGTPTPTGWSPSGTVMTGYTEGLVTDTDFAGGKAWEWAFTNPSSGAGFRSLTQNLPASWSVGDTLLFTARTKVTSVAGVPVAQNVGLRFNAGFISSATPTVQLTYGDATVHTAELYSWRRTVPASTTSIQLTALVGAIPTTGQLTARVGELGVFNLTTLGLA